MDGGSAWKNVSLSGERDGHERGEAAGWGVGQGEGSAAPQRARLGWDLMGIMDSGHDWDETWQELWDQLQHR